MKQIPAILAGLLVGLLLVAVVLVIKDSVYRPGTLEHPLEFACYDDDKLVERHVGVKTATLGRDVWTIRYVDGDGNPSYYHQPTGETCRLEAPHVQAPEDRR